MDYDLEVRTTHLALFARGRIIEEMNQISPAVRQGEVGCEVWISSTHLLVVLAVEFNIAPLGYGNRKF